MAQSGPLELWAQSEAQEPRALLAEPLERETQIELDPQTELRLAREQGMTRPERLAVEPETPQEWERRFGADSD